MSLPRWPILLTVVIFILGGSKALACTCLPPPTVLDEYEKSDIVLTARLTGFEKVAAKITLQAGRDGRRVLAVVIVEKVYKGNLKTGERIKLEVGNGANCSMVFRSEQINKAFLLFMRDPRTLPKRATRDAGNRQAIFDVSICSRSSSLASAKADLAYLDNRAALAGKTRLSGVIRSFSEHAPSLAKTVLTISGSGRTITAETDQNGFFELWSLPPGKYRIEPQLPSGWKIGYTVTQPSADRPGSVDVTDNIVLVDLPAERHAEVKLYVEIDNEISGKVVSPNGAPMKGVCINAYWLTPTTDSFAIPQSCSNENGEFKLAKLPPGDYRLEVNSGGRITAQHPFEKFYFPNVSSKEQARVFSLYPGVHMKELLVQITETLPLIRISGRLTFADGHPLPEAEVRFNPTDGGRFEYAKAETGQDGNFSLTIPKGSAGKLFATTNIYEVKFEKCPKVKEMRKTQKGRASDVRSNTVKIDGETPQENIELTFKMPPLVCF